MEGESFSMCILKIESSISTLYPAGGVKMPVQPNFLERFAFYNLNAAPTPMLDLAGALAYQVVSTAVHLNLFETLAKRPLTLSELAQTLECEERGLKFLLNALESLGYLSKKEGQYANSPMTKKWFLENNGLDLNAAITCWDAFLHDLWPHAPSIVKEGKRPFNFYEYTAETPGLSHAHQKMMAGNASLNADDVVKKVKLPDSPTRLLDVGGGHAMYAIRFCLAYPNLHATVIDSEAALNSARQYVSAHGLEERIELKAADIWHSEWGEAYDILLLFNFIHHYNLEKNIALLGLASRALKSGGQIAIFDQIEGKVFGSAIRTLLQLIGYMYYLFADGRIFSRDELYEMLQKNSFSNITFHTSLQWAGQSLVTAVKP